MLERKMSKNKEKDIYAIRFEEGKHYKLYGNDYHLLLPRTMTERLESELVEMKAGCKTPNHKHEDEEQVYIILKGKARLDIDGKSKEVSEGMLAYIPRNTYHRITAYEDLAYVYIACWPEGKVPPIKTEEELREYERKLVTGDLG